MIKKLFRFPWRTRRQIEREVDAELRFHMEERVRVLMSSGLQAESAQLRALQEFGDLEDARRYMSEVDRQAETNRRRKDFMGDLIQDITYAVRKLRSAPAFAITVILTLSVGIGANTAVLNLINATLLRPPAVRDVDELAWVTPVEQNGRFGQWSLPDAVNFRTMSKSWAALTAIANIDLTLGGDDPVRLHGQAVNGNYFDLLGVAPALGRGFIAYEDSAGSGAMPIVLSYPVWKSRFNGDSAVLGKTVTMNTQLMTIVGVSPASFNGLRIGEECDFWVPIAALPRLHRSYGNIYTHRGSRWWRVIGRVAATSSVDAANAEAAVLQARMEPDEQRPEWRRLLSVAQVRGGLEPASRARMGPVLGLVMIVPLLVLGVACANVANLFVSRSVQRQKEFAVRRALGASRGRLVRQLLTECAILGVLAGGLGVLLSVGLTALVTSTAQIPSDVVALLHPDLRVFAITFVLAIGTGMVFGLLPALGATRNEITPALKNDGISMQVGRGRHRLRNAFVVSQVALSLTLLITAGLFVGSLQKALGVEPGYDPRNAISASFDFGGQGYDAARVALLEQQFLEAVASAPGIESVAMATLLPLSGSSSSTGVSREESPPEQRDVSSMIAIVSPGYFSTMRIPIVQGRPFAASDNASSPGVVIINQQLAASLWPGQNPIGKRLYIGDRLIGVGPAEVIGVARNGKYRRLSEVTQESYFWRPSSQRPIGPQGTLVVRAKSNSADAAKVTRSAMTAIDPTLPPLTIQTLEASISRTVEGNRAGAALLGTFGIIALGLAAFGIFGVIAQGVAARTREIGIRMSLGARTADVVRQFVREGLGLTLIGAVIGIGMSLAASKVLVTLLFGLTPTDVVTFLGATATLVGIAALASFVPARRAAKVDPLVALRSD